MIIDTVNPAQVVLQVTAQNIDGTPKTTLLSAKVRVYHLVFGSEVDDLVSTDLTQVGVSSIWRYIWAPVALPTGHYTIEYTLVDPDGANFVGIEDIDIRDIAKQVDLEVVKKVEVGRWKIIGNQMIFYDDDETTPLLTYDLFDQHGVPSTLNIFERKPT